MLLINDIKIEKENGKAKLIANIFENEEVKNLFFEVEEKYEKYLCYERCDAFVIGVLSYAMRTGQDIKSNIPMTSEIHYKITDILIPSLIKNDKNLYNTKIDVPLKFEPIENASAVGTGLSGGVDSFHCITKHLNSEYKDLNITHLCIFNVGSFSPYGINYDSNKIKEERYNAAQEIAKELNLPIILTNSNYTNLFMFQHSLIYTYSGAFAILCLQKLWGTYFWGSNGYSYTSFDLKDNSIKDSTHYELLSLNCFSTKNLKIYDEGGAYNRVEKTTFIADNKLAQKFLHVCVNSNKNCGLCHKCIRTILTLDGINKLDDFSNVFDVQYFYKNKNKYMKQLYKSYLTKEDFSAPIYELQKKNINIFIRINVLIWYFFRNILKINQIFSVKNEFIKNSYTKRKVITIFGKKFAPKYIQKTYKKEKKEKCS